MKNKSIKSALFAATAGAMLIAGTGVASAAPAAQAIPNAANMLCGTVHNGTWAHNSPPPTGSDGVANVKIKGRLYDKNHVKQTDFSTTDRTSPSQPYTGGYDTDDAGRYCIKGTSGMVPTIMGGGYVTLEVIAPHAVTSTINTPIVGETPLVNGDLWTKDGTVAGTQIRELVFLDHGHASSGIPILIDSAKNFNFSTK